MGIKNIILDILFRLVNWNIRLNKEAENIEVLIKNIVPQLIIIIIIKPKFKKRLVKEYQDNLK